jgi:small acid-soluble spore protein H (minor)
MIIRRLHMDSRRAREILSSSDMVNVTYNGKPIYIENVVQDTASIHYLNKPEEKKEVPLNDLLETRSF